MESLALNRPPGRRPKNEMKLILRRGINSSDISEGWGQATPEPNENLLHHVGGEQADWQWIHLLIYNLRPELPAHNLLLIMFLFDTPPLCNKIPKFIGLTTMPALILKNCSLRSCLLFAHAQGIGFCRVMCRARCA